MKLEVTWRCTGERQHAKIENVDIDDDEGGFEDIYVSVSGYFGPYSPHVFAAAPDLYEALDAVFGLVCLHGNNKQIDAMVAAMSKARGEA